MASSAFTLKHKTRIREIITDIGVSFPIFEKNIELNDNRINNTKALWDTGATDCAITKQTALDLGLKPISQTKVIHANGEDYANVYLVNIYLPNKLLLPGVRVTECVDPEDSFGVIIGMDVITMGDFSITNVNNTTTVSYRYPSIKTIDYVEESQKKKKDALKKIGRNTPCPCGSGKKYKHCCGSL